MEQTTKEVSEEKGRRVFLSVLGTSNYIPCVYCVDQVRLKETRFVQCASLEYYKAKEWDSRDRVYIFLTEKARKENWVVAGNVKKDRNGNTIPYAGLEEELKGMGLPAPYEGVRIPGGEGREKSEKEREEEIWEIFKTIYEKLEEGDRVYLDITHGFRYIPMLVMVLLNYAKFLKHIKVMGVLYGSWEDHNPDGTVPLVDLLSISGLLDWTAAADQYISAGSSDKLHGLYMPEVRRSRSEEVNASGHGGQGFRSADNPRMLALDDLQSLLKSVRSLDKELLTCHGTKIVSGSTAQKILGNIGLVKKNSETTLPLPQPFIPLLDKIGEEAKPYRPDSIRNLFIAARACCEHRMYQQALTFLDEGIITFICDKFSLDWTKEADRNCASSGFYLSQRSWLNNTQPQDNNGETKHYKEDVIRQIQASPAVMAIGKDVSDMTELRNQYMHCALSKKKNAPEGLIAKIEKLVEKLSYERLEGYFEQQGNESTADPATLPAGGINGEQ